MCISPCSPEGAIALEYGRWAWWGEGIRETNSLFVVSVLLDIFLGFTDKSPRAEGAEKGKGIYII